MGSFPNKTAANILTMLFKDKTAAAAPAMYTTNTSGSSGIFTTQSAGQINLYIGLIEGTYPTGTPSATLDDVLIDANIVSSGATAPVSASPPNGLLEYTGQFGTTRQAITFATVTNPNDGPDQASIQGPTSTVNFGVATSNQTTNKSVIGFFITTLSSGGNASALPTVVAYGHLSSSRYIQSGDQPTFATNAITITLD